MPFVPVFPLERVRPLHAAGGQSVGGHHPRSLEHHAGKVNLKQCVDVKNAVVKATQMKTYISKESLVVDEEGRLRGGQARRGEEEIIQGQDCA